MTDVGGEEQDACFEYADIVQQFGYRRIDDVNYISVGTCVTSSMFWQEVDIRNEENEKD